MAENIIRVNTNSLDQTRRELQAKLDKIKKDVEQMANAMAQLNSMWTGEAHQTFEQRVNEDIQFLSGACDSMQGIIRYEEHAVTEYNKCEQQVADLIAQIRS